jgi:hypothetical protein
MIVTVKTGISIFKRSQKTRQEAHPKKATVVSLRLIALRGS